MNRVRFVEPARLEILAEVGFYHRIQAVLGAKFLEAVEDATARALAYPLAGSPAQHRTRRVFLRDFPFSLVYRSDEQGITIYSPLQEQPEGDPMQTIKNVHWQEDGSWLGNLEEFPDDWTQGDTLSD